MWPSRLAALIPGHVFSTRSSGAVLAAFNKQGDDDRQRFRSLRATELRSGGRLVIVIAARGDDGMNELKPLMDHANAVLRDFISEQDYIGSRARADRCAGASKKSAGPFGSIRGKCVFSRSCHGTLRGCSWTRPSVGDYQRDHDRQQVAVHQAGFFRAAFGPTFASALDKNRSAADRAAFVDKLEQGMVHRIAADPVATPQFIGVMVIAKA